VEVTTSAGAHLYPVKVTKATETFDLPASSEPIMVLFDKGGTILKTADFHKEKKEWLHQLKHATDFSDRADAAVALRAFKYEAGKAGDNSAAKNEDVIDALADAMMHDSAWGIRALSADSLGQVGGPLAAKKILEALNSAKEPWVRNRLVTALGEFKDDKEVVAKLESVAAHDDSYRARSAALQAIGKLKSPDALATLNAAIAADSPDDILRNAALRSLGSLGDDKAVPVLREWVAIGKPMPSRSAAISSLAKLQKDNKDITLQLASFLSEPHFSVRIAALFALGSRHDPAALPALEAMLKSDDLSIELAPLIKSQIALLKKPAGKPGQPPAAGAEDDDDEAGGAANAGSNDKDAALVAERLEKLEHLVEEMNARLKSMESRLPAK
jgi:HEAT repeat protein